MNKTKFFLFICAIAVLGASTSIMANAPLAAEATLSFRTEAGATKSFRLLVKNNTLSLNGTPLSESAPVLDRQALALAFSIMDSPLPRSCATGIYEHHVTRAGKTRRERGCLEEPRFAALYSAYQSLRKNP